MKRKLTIPEIRQIELDILKYFHKFCEENNLTYYLAYGTLLGAVRHKGFIPWDDDIDVHMPRKDLEKLIEIFNKKNTNKDIEILTIYNNPNFYMPLIRLVNKNTIINRDNIFDIKCDVSIWLDIFPLDNMSDDYKDALSLNRKAKTFRWLANQKIFKFNINTSFSQKIKNIFHNIIKFCLRPVSVEYLMKKTDRISKKYMQQEMTKYVGWAANFKANIYPSSYFKERVLLEFEGDKFYAPKEYDKILTEYFGNYMDLPPMDARVGHNMEEVYWIDSDQK